MGAIVVQPHESTGGEYTVIDGQQRLATLSVLAIAVVRRIRDLVAKKVDEKRNLERVNLLSADFLGKKDAASLTYSSKLTLNETDDPLYQGYLRQFKDPINEKQLPKSSRMLLTAYRYFDEKIGSQISRNGKALAEFLSRTLASQLLFIRISVQDQLNAYTVFETLNARGVELSATDLLKNYLFSLMKTKADLARIKLYWSNVVSTVRYEHFPELLRYYLSLSQPVVRKERLFKTLRDTVRNPKSAFNLLDDLAKYAEIFVALGDPTHEMWSQDKELRQYVRSLVIFRVRQLYPLLFAANKKFSERNFKKVLKILVAVSFRYNVVSGLNANYLERAYNEAAIKIMTGKMSKPAQVFGSLNKANIYVHDKKFVSDFSSYQWKTSGTGKRLVRYVLYALENALKQDARDFEEDGGTIEHVLPENPAGKWSSIIAGVDWEQYVTRIGNLTLLERHLNRRISGKDPGTKEATYKGSVYGMTRRTRASRWSVSMIEARGTALAERASEIWRVDVARE